MSLHRPVLVTLLLLAPASALAERRPTGRMLHMLQDSFSTEHTVRIVRPEADDGLAAVTAALSSEVGDEELALVEADAWLHGAAGIRALPATDAALALTVYDADNTVVASFSGRLSADGVVALAADVRDGCTSRIGCHSADVELLRAEVYPADAGYDVGFDLSGADTAAIAYADISVTEWAAAEPCTSRESTACGSTDPVRTTAEVAWDTIGSVWEATPTLQHTGLVEVTVTSRDGAGERLDETRSRLGQAWGDGGGGIGTLATDEDPLTTLAFLYGEEGTRIRGVRSAGSLAVLSEGWTVGDDVPTAACVEITGGETLTIPVQTYMRAGRSPAALFEGWEDIVEARRREGYSTRLSLARNGSPEPLTEMTGPVCGDGVCVAVTATAAGYELSATAFGDDASALLDEAEVVLALVDEADAVLARETRLVELDDTVSALFVTDVAFGADPTGLDVAGKVSLLAAPNREGRRATLAKGKFYGTFFHNGAGGLTVAGLDRHAVGAWDTPFIAGESDTDVQAPLVVPHVVTSRLVGVPRRTVYALSVQSSGSGSPIY